MKNILIINPFGIGDVLFTSPVICAIKLKFPDSYIAYLCSCQVSPLLKDNPAVNELMFFSRGEFKKVKSKSLLKAGIFLLRAVSQLRSRKFDLVVDLSLVTQYSFIMKLIGIPERWGFDYKNRGMFLTHKIRIDSFSGKHVIEYYRDLLNKMGIKDFYPRTELHLDKDAEIWADDFLKRNGVSHDDLLIGVSAFGGDSWGEHAANKHWPIEKFAAVIKVLIEKHKAKVVFFGLEKDKAELDEICKSINYPEAINAAGKTDLGQLAALISCLDVFIGNDSGTLHMASALDIKTISIFGPVDEQVYGPVGDAKLNLILKKDMKCRPCYKNFKKPLCRTMDCLEQITEQDLLKAVESIL
ncbi:MAG: glycosyltransferase family 9 protein [Candidatus Omnitrophota bacterium]